MNSIEAMRDSYLATPAGIGSKGLKNNSQTDTEGQSFGDILKFSKHASQRLNSRNIELSGEQQMRLSDAAGKARDKGMNESLVMVDDLAFIVNVKNNTVVTAVNGTANAIFTNIDGAIIG